MNNTGRCEIISKFVSCRDMFTDDQDACDLVARMSQNEARMYTRYGYIPLVFYEYLRIKGIIEEVPREIIWSKERRTVWELSDLLLNSRPMRQDGQMVADYIRKKLIDEFFPELKKSFASSEHILKVGP